jgi:class 3 adenylate cyclase
MKEQWALSRAKSRTVALTALALGLFGYLASLLRWQSVPISALAFFAPLGLLAEMAAARTAFFGAAGIAFPLYLTLIILYDNLPLTAITVFSTLLPAALLRRRQPVWHRLARLSASFVTIVLSSLAYRFINSGASLMTAKNIAAAFLTLFIYLALDFLIMHPLKDLIEREKIESWNILQNKIRFITLAIAPLALPVAMVIQTSGMNLWGLFLMLLPLAGMRYTLGLAVREGVVMDQQSLVDSLSTMEKSFYSERDLNKRLAADMEKKNEELTIFYEMSRQLGESMDLPSTLKIITSMIQKLMLYECCAISLMAGSRLVQEMRVPPRRETVDTSSLELEESSAQEAVSTRTPILRPIVRLGGFRECSLVCMPLMLKNEAIGAIYVSSEKAEMYNETHLRLLAIIANAASHAINISQLNQQMDKKNKTLQGLNQQLDRKIHASETLLGIEQKLSSSLNLEETQRTLVQGMEEMFNYQSLVLFMRKSGPDGDYMSPAVIHSPYEQFFKNCIFPVDESTTIMGTAVRNRRSLLLKDAQESQLMTILAYERSVMVSPMIVRNEVMGLIYIGHSEPCFYDEEALALMETMTYTAAMALKNAMAFMTYVPGAQHVISEISGRDVQVQEKEITVVFFDIEGYTEMAANKRAWEIFAILKDLYGDILSPFIEQGGEILTYLGDAAMITFGAFQDLENHSERALLASLEFKHKLRELNKARCASRLVPLNVGIGICTGEAAIGILGKGFKEVSVIGNTTNTAARLQGISKQQGFRIIINDKAYSYLKDRYLFTTHDKVVAKGLPPMTVYGYMEYEQ